MAVIRRITPWPSASTPGDLEPSSGGRILGSPQDLCDGFPEEFNKYLSYVRNLGFEDTPDYDYLRDLFTKALQNTGEVEDGEYDWMKLNNGKGWDVPTRPSAAAGHREQGNPSNADLHRNNLNRASNTPQIDKEKPLPSKPGAVRQQNAQRSQPGRRPQNSADLGKRGSGMQLDTPDHRSTAAQFQNSRADLTRGASASANQLAQPQSASATQQRPAPQQPPPEQKEGFMQKVLKVLCCG